MNRTNCIPWEKVDYSDVSAAWPSSDNTSNVEYLISPSDVPSAWRECIDPVRGDQSKVFMEFKYLSSSEPIKELMSEGVTFKLGKNSNRVYEIELLLKNIGAMADKLERDGMSDLRYELEALTLRLVSRFLNSPEIREGNAEAIKSIIESSCGAAESK